MVKPPGFTLSRCCSLTTQFLLSGETCANRMLPHKRKSFPHCYRGRKNNPMRQLMSTWSCPASPQQSLPQAPVWGNTWGVDRWSHPWWRSIHTGRNGNCPHRKDSFPGQLSRGCHSALPLRFCLLSRLWFSCCSTSCLIKPKLKAKRIIKNQQSDAI